jgi:multimeric flavodoxin WrbA
MTPPTHKAPPRPPTSAFVVDGSESTDKRTQAAAQAVREALDRAGMRHETVVARDVDIGSCTGCFGCWIKTPGECALGGPSIAIARSCVANDLLVLVTPVTFGGFSYQTKKLLDRTVCSLVLPFFTRVDGEVHHPKRYAKLPELVGVGTLPSADEEAQRVFETMIGRNARNLHSRRWAVEVVVGDPGADEVAPVVDALLARAGVTPSRRPSGDAPRSDWEYTLAPMTREVAR